MTAGATQSPIATKPLTRIADFTFVDSRHGWMLGSSENEQASASTAVLRRTSDGGETWQPESTPAVAVYAENPSDKTVRHVKFADEQNGWLYGTGLYVTHNGGQTWKQEALKGEMIDMSTAGKDVWAIDRQCDQSMQKCRLMLLASLVDGSDWKPASVQPPFTGPSARLIRMDARDAWLLSYGYAYNGTTGSALFVTHDGGKSWQKLADPLDPRMYETQLIAVADTRHVWMVGGGEPATAQQGKAVYTSADGGEHWTLEALVGPPDQKQVGSISLSGHVSDLAAPTAGRAFLALTRDTLISSTDGGRTWKDSIPPEQAGAGDAGVGMVLFADRQHGWAVAEANWLFRTTDGGQHWRKVVVR